MGREILDIYSDYLLYSTRQTTATGLSELLNGEISHDIITRFLSSESFDEKTLWKKVKKLVRLCEEENACCKNHSANLFLLWLFSPYDHNASILFRSHPYMVFQ